jgi:hypothetical protein
MTVESHDDPGGVCPPYPHTPEELRRIFIVHARGIEGALYSLSQDIYNEVAEVRNEKPPTHAEVAERIKKVLEDGLQHLSTDGLMEHARAADKAFGYPVADEGEKPNTPHT